MSEWLNYKLGEVLVVKYGKDHKSLNSGNIPCYGSGGIMRYVDSQISEGPSILIPRKGSLSNILFCKSSFWTVDTMFWSIIKSNLVDPRFLYYQLTLIDWSNMNVGSAVPSLTVPVINDVEVRIPTRENQIAIAEILSSIDDKIDLLNRQNETLEAMAQTLFRQWFIEEADESWEEVELGELVETTTGISYKSSNLCASNIHMLNLKSFNRDGSIRLDGYKEFQGDFKEKHTCTNGDILVAHTDVTQDASLLGNAIEVINLYGADKMIYSMDLVKVIPIDNTNRKFILYTLKCGGFKEHAISMSNGSTVLHLSKKALPTFHIKLPPKELRLLFNEYASSIQARITSNYHSMRSLMTLRVTLLPKLMSGEVRVKLD